MKKQGRNTEVNKKIFLESLSNNFGIVTDAAKETGIAAKTHYEWMKADDDYKQLVDDLDDKNLDFVERKLFEKISEGSEKMILWYMMYKGHKRGYIKKQEITNVNIEQPLFPDMNDDSEE